MTDKRPLAIRFHDFLASATDMNNPQYKKTWYVITAIARILIGASAGDRIPTLQELVDFTGSSRGLVQNALKHLQDEGGVCLLKKGKMGTFISAIDVPALFRLGNLNFITGSMPTPLTLILAGLATGICRMMNDCPVPFTFAFVQAAENRVDALLRRVYDFVVVSEKSAQVHVERHPELAAATALSASLYAKPYVLCTRDPSVSEVKDGMKMAADPKSTDQYMLTLNLCQGKNVEIVPCAFTTSHALFSSGAVDAVVFNNDEWMRAPGIYAWPLPIADQRDSLRPCVLIHKDNLAIGDILRKYLRDSEIAQMQADVVEGRAQAQYF
ncbi:MAG: GntR family transcriptional regulator [Clostridiales bacterium]|jgi:hypothetical protein|nr:GntR family transcriptional regulator [Clostridiales bacterium]